MTRKHVVETIKHLGLRCTYDPETEEYRVAYRNNDEASTYYTNDGQDAINTAVDMQKQRR